MALKRHISIDQGSTFSETISAKNANGVDITVTGYSSNAQLRKYYSTNTYISFNTTVNTNTVTISLTALQTANIIAGRYLYDVVVTSPSNTVTRIVEGIATINPSITR